MVTTPGIYGEMEDADCGAAVNGRVNGKLLEMA